MSSKSSRSGSRLKKPYRKPYINRKIKQEFYEQQKAILAKNEVLMLNDQERSACDGGPDRKQVIRRSLSSKQTAISKKGLKDAQSAEQLHTIIRV